MAAVRHTTVDDPARAEFNEILGVIIVCSACGHTARGAVCNEVALIIGAAAHNCAGKRANNETCHQVCAELFLLAFLVIGLNLDGDSPACFKVTFEADLVCAPWINNGTVFG